MPGWCSHRGQALALPFDNIDTDQLIPARFMSQPRSAGYSGFLMHDIRRDSDERMMPDFPLNRHPEASILLAGRNFGVGSSREAAVYALVDAGIRAVIAPSFGDIFANNAINNGLLPATLSAGDVARLAQVLGQDTTALTIDLETRVISADDFAITFDLNESWRVKLINGWDDIDLTEQYAAAISAFKNNRNQTAPWAWPGSVD